MDLQYGYTPILMFHNKPDERYIYMYNPELINKTTLSGYYPARIGIRIQMQSLLTMRSISSKTVQSR